MAPVQILFGTFGSGAAWLGSHAPCKLSVLKLLLQKKSLAHPCPRLVILELHPCCLAMAAPGATPASSLAMGQQVMDMQAEEDFWHEVYSIGGECG